MKCKGCGAEIDSNDRFCRICGRPVDESKKVVTKESHKSANVKEEGYADNIFSKSGRFDANYIIPVAILIGVLILISGVLKMYRGAESPSETTAETQVSWEWEEDYGSLCEA